MARNDKMVKVVTDQGPLAWVFFVAYIGAVVYFFQLDFTFGGFIVALLKGAVWPGYVIFEVLGNLGIQ